MSAEIITFPKKKKQTVNDFPETVRDSKAAVAEYRMKLINDMLNTRFTQTMKDFSEFGFPVENKEFVKNVVFANEILRAVLYRSASIHHPLYKDTVEMRKAYEKGLTALNDIDKMFDSNNEE